MPTLTASEVETVMLKGGVSVPLPALQLLWNLENRGLTVKLDDTGALLVGPRGRLTPRDRGAIQRNRDTLARLVTYCCDEAVI